MFKKRFLDERGLKLLWTKIKKYITQNFVSVDEAVTQVVTELPTVGKSRYIYLVPKEDGGTAGNLFDEYLWDEDNEEFELIGTTHFGVATQTADGLMSADDKKKLDGIDLSQYSTTEEVTKKLDEVLENYNKTSNFKTINGQSIIGTGNIVIEMDVESITIEEIDELFEKTYGN